MARVDRWRYCPRCGAELEHSHERVDCPECAFVSHSNSEPTVGALVIDDEGRLLLVRRAGDPHSGTWDVPGGFLEEAEHPLDALRRELLEETGLEIEPGEYFGAWVDTYHERFTLNLYWRAAAVAGEERPADDVSELRWFAREELPPRGELAFTTVPVVLDAWLAAAPACNVRPESPSSAQ